MLSVQDDPSEPDNHRRQEAAIDTSPDLVPKDDVNDNPKETENKRTEDITAIKQALASDKDRDPESLHFALLEKKTITPIPRPPTPPRPLTHMH